MEKKTVIINGTEKEVIINNVYTRKIDKEYNSILFKGTNFGADKSQFQINQDNVQNANDYLVKAMSNLTEEEIGELANSDYQDILQMIMEVKDPLLKNEKSSNKWKKPSEPTEG